MSIKLSLKSLVIVIIIDMISAQLIKSLASFANVHQEPFMNFTRLGNKIGLTVIEHDVTTIDGYVLTLFQVPGNKTRPALLAHGVFGTSDIFIARGKTSLVYTLAMEGYDVWALNIRGTRYSRKHISLDPDKDKEFWNFSIHEHGYYDLAAIIDYVLNETGQQQLNLIGISEGTTITFVLGTTRPEYNQKIKVFLALAPIVYLHNVGLPTSLMVQLSSVINEVFVALGQEEVFGYRSMYKAIYDIVCRQKFGYDLCVKIGLFPVTGADSAELEPEFFQETIDMFPDGTSRKNMLHYAQIAKRKIFAKYDYGKENFAVYGSDLPPVYDLDKFTIDVALICGKNDKLSTINDVQILRKKLSNVIAYRLMPQTNFNHIDHIWGRNAHKISYPFLFKILSRYN